MVEKEGRIDLLVNSAYGGLTAMTPHFGKPFWERPISVFDASINKFFFRCHDLLEFFGVPNTSFIMKVECPAAKNHYILGHD